MAKNNGTVKTNGSGSVKNLQEVIKKWPDLLTSIRPMNHSVEALLRSSRPRELENGTITLEVFYKFHKERLEEEKCRRVFEEAFEEVFERPVRLKCILAKKEISSRVDPVKTKPAETQPIASSSSEDILEVAKDIFGN